MSSLQMPKVDNVIISKKDKIATDLRGIINSKNVLSWQQKIGFVSQDTFILKGSILENIAFGVQEIDYDYVLIKEVLKLANLEEFVAKRNLNYLKLTTVTPFLSL